MKPHKEFYIGLMNRINNFNKEEMLCIGDELEKDIRGGIDNGIDTCWFNLERISSNDEYTPKYQINNLLELKQIL
jgi:2-haloacid dehalogenase